MENDRLKKLTQRRDQINALISKLGAQKQAQERRADTRRKIVAGAILLAAVERDRTSQKPTGLARWWDTQVAGLTRPQDRSLFSSSVDDAEQSEARSPHGV